MWIGGVQMSVGLYASVSINCNYLNKSVYAKIASLDYSKISQQYPDK